MIVDDITENLKDRECLIEAYGRKLGLSAEDCVLIEERNEAIVCLVELVKEMLSDREFYYFLEWVHGSSYADIGRLHIGSIPEIFKGNARKSKQKQQIMQSNLGKRKILNILKKLKILNEKNEVIYMKDVLMDKTIGSKWGSDHIAFDWPSDMARTHVASTRLTKNKEWVPVKKCMVPEYLSCSFKDNGTICSYCGTKCTRKADNKGILRKSKGGKGMEMGE